MRRRSARARRRASAPTSSATRSPTDEPASAHRAGRPDPLDPLVERQRGARSPAATQRADQHDERRRDEPGARPRPTSRSPHAPATRRRTRSSPRSPRGSPAARPREHPARLREQHVEDEADRQHPDRPARERQVERHRRTGQRRRREHPHAARLLPLALRWSASSAPARTRCPSRSSRSAGTRPARAESPPRSGTCPAARRVSRPARAIAANAAAVQRSNIARSPTRATALPVSTRTKRVQERRDRTRTAPARGRPTRWPKRASRSPSRQCAGSQCKAGTPAVEWPAGDRNPTDKSQRQNGQPTRPTCPGKNPPARKPSHAVAGPGRVRYQRAQEARARARTGGLKRRPSGRLMALRPRRRRTDFGAGIDRRRGD